MNTQSDSGGLNAEVKKEDKIFKACLTEACEAHAHLRADTLNQHCYCKTLDYEKLNSILNADEFNRDLLFTHPHLFSNTAVFISPMHLKSMRAIIASVENVIALPSYQHQVQRRNTNALFNPGTSGVFMGYDFHISHEGPQIIEINTNAGGGVFKFNLG